MISSFTRSAVITFSKLLLQEMCLGKVLITVHNLKKNKKKTKTAERGTSKSNARQFSVEVCGQTECTAVD